MTKPIDFNNSYARLPEQFYSRQAPSAVKSPALIRANTELASELGIDPGWVVLGEAIDAFAGNQTLPGSEPIATVYAGHQFGGWNPQLGDGRAILLGEVIGRDGHRYDIQLKGAGQTAYSRRGDGRAPLGPVLREYIVSEAMAAMSVPTTRSLAAVTTGEEVVREAFEPGAILTRVASSHIRVGTFQFFGARGDTESVRALTEHSTQRHFPDAINAENPVLAFLESVIDRQANLIAQWQLLGFIHGVMNTDNMLICGETVDYGPCAFMDDYHPNTVFSSIDTQGRYAYANQPSIAHWNLSWLAQSLLPLISDDEEKAVALAQDAINRFPERYEEAYRAGMLRKLGFDKSDSESAELIQPLLKLMAEARVDFTLCFRKLSDVVCLDSGSAGVEDSPALRDLFDFPTSFDLWLEDWRTCLKTESIDLQQAQARMRAVNPAFIPRNHLIQEVIDAAVEQDNFQPFHTLVDLLADPYKYVPEKREYATPPRPEQVVQRTFCGT